MTAQQCTLHHDGDLDVYFEESLTDGTSDELHSTSGTGTKSLGEIGEGKTITKAAISMIDTCDAAAIVRSGKIVMPLVPFVGGDGEAEPLPKPYRIHKNDIIVLYNLEGGS